ncbi:MAG: MFS transporter [Syntrophorhabdaceae bacterium]|nr:MFS transporter [Syntrophorhabdaceae bacterium]
MKTGNKLFYGWYVLASSFTILFFTSGARYSIGVMFKPMLSEFGWNRASISLAFFIHMAVFAISVSVIGKLYDRYGPKWVIIISTIFLSCGFILTATINSLWQLFLFYGFLAAVGLGGTSVPMVAALTSKWFDKWRGLAVSLALSGNSLGQFALVPVFTFFTIHYGWRYSYLFIGFIMLAVNIVLALFVIKGDPHQLGLKPLGAEETKKEEKDKEKKPSIERTRDLTLPQAMGTKSFWFFTIAMFICGSGDFFITTHLIAFVTDLGFSSVTGGNMLAWYGFMSLLGILVAGPLSDVIGNKIPIAATFFIRAILLLLILKYKNITMLYIFAFTFGFTHLMSAPLTPTLLGKLYGFSNIGAISGFVNTIHHTAGGFWAYMGGVIFDKTGSYTSAFIISAIMAIIAFISTILIREKRHEIKI